MPGERRPQIKIMLELLIIELRWDTKGANKCKKKLDIISLYIIQMQKSQKIATDNVVISQSAGDGMKKTPGDFV